MPINPADIFKCTIHDFSCNNIEEWDEHCAKEEHEYDLHIPCANKCGTQLHIKPKMKLDKSAKRIPRGFLCKNCQKKVKEVKEVKEPGELEREKKNES